MKRSRRRALTPQQMAEREEQMRPSRFIGYDHDSIAMHLIAIGSFDLAESELRRAVWLNPFEPRFMKHLAWCLYRQGEYEEAQGWVSRALEMNGKDGESRELLAMIEAKLMAGGTEA